MTLALARPQEAPVEIVYQIRSAPVQMTQYGGGIRRYEAAHHQSDPAGRQELQHRRESDIGTNQRRVHIRKGALDVGERGVDQQRSKRYQNPGPRPQDVMRQVE